MGKNGISKRARAAKTKCLQKRSEKTKSDKSHASSEMINKALDQEFAGLLKMKVHKNGLLDVSIVKQDARAPIMRRNKEESLLLRIPAELCNKIFRMVVGDQHIHISVLDLPKKPAGDIHLTPTPIINLPYHGWSDLRYSSDQKSRQPWKNTTYPLVWRDYYTTQPIKENQLFSFLHHMRPEKRIVWDSGDHFTQLAMVCRQIYDEVGLVPYSTNERQAIKVLWMDNEWAGYGSAPMDLKDLSPTDTTLKVSPLAWKTVSRAYWKLHEHRDILDTPIDDFDADMDNFFEFEEWLEPVRKIKPLEVDYVND